MTATSHLQRQRPPSTKSLKPLLWLVAIGFFMQSLDTTIVNTALPGMAHSLGESPLHMQSVVIAYVLSMAAVIPASGWVTDRFGLRAAFLAAISLFSMASLLCALSQDLTQLVIARSLQGMGGAMLMPVGRLALLKIVPRPQFLAALSFITIPGLIGPLIGPTLGGWLVQVASWHWIFLINLPIGLVGALMTLKVMPALKRVDVPAFDLSGYVLLVVGMVSLSLALDSLAERSVAHAGMSVLLVAGIAAIVSYWLHANKAPNALFQPDLFHTRTFTIGIFGNLFARLGGGAMPFLLPLLLQVALDYTPSQAGLMMIPLVLGSMACKRAISPMVKRFGYRRVMVSNTLLVGFTMASVALTSHSMPTWLHVLHFFIFGFFNSIQFTTMNTLTLKDLDQQHAGSGNGLMSMTMMLSMSLGVAIASAILNGFTGLYGEAHLLQAFRATFVCVGLITMMATWIFWQLPTTEMSEPKHAADTVGMGE